ncbi:MAG: hypothetical protein MJE68_14870 [Proteobacteria bacterium]|nr:hypothetical protein [Pseudomonadota bacterium]
MSTPVKFSCPLPPKNPLPPPSLCYISPLGNNFAPRFYLGSPCHAYPPDAPRPSASHSPSRQPASKSARPPASHSPSRQPASPASNAASKSPRPAPSKIAASE